MTRTLLRILPYLMMPLSTASLPAAEPAAAPDPAAVWDLTPLFKDEAAFLAARERIAAGLPRIKTYEGRLGESAATLREAMDLVYALRKDLARVAVYASLTSDEDIRNAPNLERTQQVELLESDFARAASFIDPELLAVGEAKLKAFVDSDPKLAPYRFPILDTLRLAPHTLGAEAEGVLSAASLVTDSPHAIYGVLANADLPWPTVRLADGKEVRLDQAGYGRWRSSTNRADREAVFRAFWPKMKEYERTFGVALFSQVKSDWFRASVRKHRTSVASALSAGNVPEAVYRTLVAETNANLPTLHRYFRLRGKMLGISDLRYWDIYPPIVSLDKKFTYAEAKTLALAGAQPLGPDYVAEYAACLNGRYTHVYPQQGKRSGAYMNGSAYDVHAFVLHNFNDDYDGVTTLAHEWGHGLHSQLANRNQPFPTARYSIFTAEIASTLNEALLLDQMLKVAKSDDERLFYLGNGLERLRATFFRQAMFAEFELLIHEEVEKGGALSGAKLTQIYGDILRRYHGDAQGVMKIDDLVTVEWAYIPHFYYNFYVYQYATSIAASQLFAERILKGEPGAVDTYLGLLKAGGSDYPYDLVKRAGVDLAGPAPYRALAARMNRIMDEIEAILAKKQK